MEGYILDSFGLCKVFYDFRTGIVIRELVVKTLERFVTWICEITSRFVLKFSLYAGLMFPVLIVGNLESFVFNSKRM